MGGIGAKIMIGDIVFVPKLEKHGVVSGYGAVSGEYIVTYEGAEHRFMDYELLLVDPTCKPKRSVM